jgi:hypothetical protein
MNRVLSLLLACFASSLLYPGGLAEAQPVATAKPAPTVTKVPQILPSAQICNDVTQIGIPGSSTPNYCDGPAKKNVSYKHKGQSIEALSGTTYCGNCAPWTVDVALPADDGKRDVAKIATAPSVKPTTKTSCESYRDTYSFYKRADDGTWKQIGSTGARFGKWIATDNHCDLGADNSIEVKRPATKKDTYRVYAMAYTDGKLAEVKLTVVPKN